VPSSANLDQDAEQRIESNLKETIELCERFESGATVDQEVKLTWEEVESDAILENDESLHTQWKRKLIGTPWRFGWTPKAIPRCA
jgi:hypothetical protein